MYDGKRVRAHPVRLRKSLGVLILAAVVVVGVAVTAVRPGRVPYPLLSLKDSGGSITSVAFSPDGRVIAAGDEYGFAYLRDARTGRLLRRLLDPGQGYVATLAYEPDGKVLATGDEDGTTFLWDTATGRQLGTLRDPDTVADLTSVAFSPGGVLLAVGDDDGGAYLWNTATGHEITRLAFPSGLSSQLVDPAMVASSPDRNVVAVASKAGVVLSSASTGQALACVPGIRGAYFGGLTFSPDGRMLAAGISDGALVWSVATLHRLAVLARSACAGSTGIAFSPDGRLLATGAGTPYTGAACVWNVAIGRPDEVFADPAGFVVDAVAFSPDGRLLATGDNDDGDMPATNSPRTLIWKESDWNRVAGSGRDEQ